MKNSLFFVAFASLVLASSARATPYYVNNNNCGYNQNCNGLYPDCWSQGVSNCAKHTIQAGMDLAQNAADVVNVAPGTYTGTGNRDLEFPRTNNVARAFTVRCDGAPGSCTIDCQGSVPCELLSSPSQHRGFLFNKDYATNNSVVEGFTIKNGCIASGTNTFGGAILVDGSEPTIRGCIFEQNKATNGGGIAFVGDGETIFQPVLDDCTIKNNSTRSNGNGGGVYCVQAVDAVVKDCWIHDNIASGSGRGGGLYWDAGSDARIEDCIIEGNTAGNGGGGVWISLNKEFPPTFVIQPAPHIVRSRIGPNNSTTNSHGGGIRMDGQYPANPELWIVNCTIIQNHADASFGGGVALTGAITTGESMTVNVVNSIIAGNSANSGGGLYVYEFTPTILANVTMMHNTVPVENGGSAILFDGRSASSVSNTILWYDVLPPAQAQVRVLRNGLKVLRSDVQDALPIPGTGGVPPGVTSIENISSNPSFVDQDGADNNANTLIDNDYHLSTGSPCIDTGAEFLVPADIIDVDEDTNIVEPTPELDLLERVQRCEVDMGTYEVPPSIPITVQRPVQDQNGFCFEGTSAVYCSSLGTACAGAGTCWPLAKNRSLSFSNPNGVTASNPTGQTAIRVKLVDLQNPNPPNLPQFAPPNFSGYESGSCVPRTCVGGAKNGATCVVPAPVPTDCPSPGVCTTAVEDNGCARWVGKPGTFLEDQDVVTGATYRAARLQCTPLYIDWSDEGLIHVVGAEILPSSVYEINVLPKALCENSETACTDVSCMALTTARSGDVAANFNPPATSTQPDSLDVAQVVAKVKNLPGAPVKAIAQLQTNLVELNANVSVLDIVAVVDAVKGIAYVFSGPCPCPSTVTCGPGAGSVACSSTTQCVSLFGAGALCVKTCVGGTNAGYPCINDTHGHCPGGGVCGNGGMTPGFCRDRCGRCN